MSPFAFLILLCGIALAGGLIPWITYRRISQVWRRPNLCFIALIVLGVILGACFATYSRLISPTTRVMGFPFPFVAFQLENGHWMDFVVPAAIAVIILNVLLLTSSVLLLAFLTSFFLKTRKAEQGAAANP
jgi:ABC-type uncharacterized transport system permease subunit